MGWECVTYVGGSQASRGLAHALERRKSSSQSAIVDKQEATAPAHDDQVWRNQGRQQGSRSVEQSRRGVRDRRDGERHDVRRRGHDRDYYERRDRGAIDSGIIADISRQALE